MESNVMPSACGWSSSLASNGLCQTSPVSKRLDSSHIDLGIDQVNSKRKQLHALLRTLRYDTQVFPYLVQCDGLVTSTWTHT
jgi:hypothetical protein